MRRGAVGVTGWLVEFIIEKIAPLQLEQSPVSALMKLQLVINLKRLKTMKKMLLKFADQVLSREELKAVRGASGCGSCTYVGGPQGSPCVKTTSGPCKCLMAPAPGLICA